MNVPALKLTLYFNETLRCRGHLAADLLLDMFEHADVMASVLLRGIEGFGAHHRLHTDRFENASLNQPIVAVAMDRQDRIEHWPLGSTRSSKAGWSPPNAPG